MSVAPKIALWEIRVVNFQEGRYSFRRHGDDRR